MGNGEIEEQLAAFEQGLEVVRLLLKDGSQYEGTLEKDFFSGLWQIRTSQGTFKGNVKHDAIIFEVEDVERVEPLDYAD
jgi:hypothetical protein